jgi:hypothetical protein
VQELSSKQLEGVMQYKEDQERRKLLEKYLKNKCTKSEKEEVFYDRIDIDRIADDKLTKSEKEEIESKFKDYRYLINGNGSEEEKENLNTYIQLKEKKIEEREMWEDYLVYLIEKYDSDRHMAYLDRDIRIECEKNADMRRRSLEIAEHSYMK